MQITRTTPLRLMILHLSHIFFTLALTFIAEFFSGEFLPPAPTSLKETKSMRTNAECVGREVELYPPLTRLGYGCANLALDSNHKAQWPI